MVIITGEDCIDFQGISKFITSMVPLMTVIGRPNSSKTEGFRASFSSLTFPEINMQSVSEVQHKRR